MHSKKHMPKPRLKTKKFIASSARAFVHNHDKKYDLIFIDVFTNKISIPMECTTREFLLDVKNLLKENGVIAANIIASPTFSDKFTVRYHNTFSSVFPVFSRQIIGSHPLWRGNDKKLESPTNTMYLYFYNQYTDDNSVYTDDKNTYSTDRL